MYHLVDLYKNRFISLFSESKENREDGVSGEQGGGQKFMEEKKPLEIKFLNCYTLTVG